MKILLVSRYAPDLPLKKGGPQSITKHLYNNLLSLGYDVHIFSYSTHRHRNKLIRLGKIFSFFIKNRNAYDLINIDTSSPNMAIILGFIRLFFKCPFVLSVHGMPSSEKTARGFQQFKQEMLISLSIRLYSQLITVSFLTKGLVANSFKPFFSTRHQIIVIHNGIPKAFFKKKQTPPLKKKTGLHLFLVGGIKERKGIFFLMDALEHLSADVDWHLTIVGAMESERTNKKFFAVVNKNKWEDRITHHNWLSKDNILKSYDGCDVVVATSRFDTFNVAVLEGMARAKPVVTTSSSGSSELIQNYQNGIIVNYGDHEALSQHVEQFSRTCSGKKIGALAVKTAYNYSWDKVAERYVNAYKIFIAGT